MRRIELNFHLFAAEKSRSAGKQGRKYGEGKKYGKKLNYGWSQWQWAKQMNEAYESQSDWHFILYSVALSLRIIVFWPWWIFLIKQCVKQDGNYSIYRAVIPQYYHRRHHDVVHTPYDEMWMDKFLNCSLLVYAESKLLGRMPSRAFRALRLDNPIVITVEFVSRYKLQI